MANIQEYLNKILLARFGKDVRGSIHDAIQAMNTQVEDSETSAGRSAIEAATKASEASAYAEQASTSANNAANSANQSESYATGDTGSAKYYYEQARTIIESLSGALRPMGTVPFANLPDVTIAVEGDMYNISDEFTTTSDFKEGSGVTVAAGSNVYKTTDGHWDVLAGSPVTGIKGDKESSYRRGNVNITTENIGAVSIGGDIEDNIVTFTSDDCGPNGDPALLEIPKLTTGEKLSSLMQKVSRIANNFRYFLKMLGTTDISAIGDGTVTGGLVALNDNLTKNPSIITLNSTYGCYYQKYLNIVTVWVFCQQNITTNTTVGTLPSGYRPSRTLFECSYDGNYTYLQIGTNGNIVICPHNGGGWCIANITFIAK